jgi:predicted AAA+ superfamily ATPase
MFIQRLLTLPEDRSVFLWGPRKTGKSWWLREHLGQAPLVDLLKSEVFADYAARPALLRDRAESPAWRR